MGMQGWTQESWDAQMNANLRGVLEFTEQLLPIMAEGKRLCEHAWCTHSSDELASDYEMEIPQVFRLHIFVLNCMMNQSSGARCVHSPGEKQLFCFIDFLDAWQSEVMSAHVGRK